MVGEAIVIRGNGVYMWFFFTDGFVSVVENRERGGELLVRSRRPEILSNLFPARDILTITDSEYRYRCSVTKGAWAAVVAERIARIDYSNFKNSIQDRKYHELCERCWGLHWRYQR
jgi:hypothetical protein